LISLVHEVYLRLVKQHRIVWQNCAHFFGIAAQTFRTLVLGQAKLHAVAGRGGWLRRSP